MRLKLQIFLITWLFFPYYLFAQLNNPDYIEKISLEIDTLAFTSVKDTIGFKGKNI